MLCHIRIVTSQRYVPCDVIRWCGVNVVLVKVERVPTSQENKLIHEVELSKVDVFLEQLILGLYIHKYNTGHVQTLNSQDDNYSNPCGQEKQLTLSCKSEVLKLCCVLSSTIKGMSFDLASHIRAVLSAELVTNHPSL